jgi:hypothetical protein
MRIVIVLLILCLWQTAGAEVYKRTLPDGSVEFTDVPPKDGAKPVQLPPITTVPATRPAAPKAAAPTTQPAAPYQSVAISSPATDATVHDNEGKVSVTTTVTPPLNPKHRLLLFLDGAPAGDSITGGFQLTNIDRGTHSLEVRIVNEAGTVLLTSSPVTFHMQRISVLLRP